MNVIVIKNSFLPEGPICKTIILKSMQIHTSFKHSFLQSIKFWE